jgi:hypothetical protein
MGSTAAAFTDEAVKAKGVTRTGNAASVVATVAAGGGNSATYGSVGANFKLVLDTGTTAALGAYVYTVVTTTYNNTAPGVYTVSTQTNDVTITVSTNATQASATLKTPAAAGATATIRTTSNICLHHKPVKTPAQNSAWKCSQRTAVLPIPCFRMW